jgi:dolichol-phosphate mannosyltransferase
MAERTPTFPSLDVRKTPEMSLVSVVIPAWNEAESMGELLGRIRAVLEPFTRKIEILIVVPSPDDPTVEAAEAGGAGVIVQKRPGYGGALKEGLLASRGEYVITMDADLSHPPESIPAILAHRKEAEVVIGSRYVRGGSAEQMSSYRALLSRILNLTYRRVLSVPVLDMSSGFRGYQRKILDELSLESEKYDILEEILVKAYSLGWHAVEVPFDYQLRAAGTSHANVVEFIPHFLGTLFRLWKIRNSLRSADYDSRAYDSLVPLQRYWHRRRFRIVEQMAGDDASRLDIGCGSSRIVQSHPDSVGLDLATAKLRFLRRTNRRLVRATCFQLPFGDHAFETVINSQLIEHIPSDRRLFLEMNRVLKPGGTLVIGTPDCGRTTWRLIGWLYKLLLPDSSRYGPITQYSRYGLTEELATAGFAILEYRYILGGELIMQCAKREECGAAAAERGRPHDPMGGAAQHARSEGT